MSVATIGWIAVVAWVLLLSFAVAGLYRAVGILSQRVMPDADRFGPRPGIRLPQVGSEEWTADTVALFVDEECQSCRTLLRRLSEEFAAPDLSRLHVLFRGPEFGSLDPAVASTENAGFAFSELGVSVTPMAIRVGEDRRVADSAPIGSVHALLAFYDGRRVAEEV